jgi:glycosyltransferase involved in cell wall biosynthesis
MGAALAVLGRSNPPPVVLVLHNPFKSWNFRVIAWSGRRWFDQVVCVSESNRDLLLDLGAPADKVISIPNGVDTERYTPHANERLPGPLRVGIVARIEVYKSHDILIEAARKLILEGVQLEVHLCGSGSYEEKLRHKVKAYGMDSHVRFLGMREDVHDVLRNLDVFALPSLVDAFPLALLEAMAAALPVVAARTGDIPRIIEHGVTGLLVEPGNSNDLAAALRRLADSPKLRNQFGERARQKAIKRYSLDDNLTCYEELFLSLIKIQTQRKNDEEIGDNHSA